MIRFCLYEVLECEFNGVTRRVKVIGLFNDAWSATMRFAMIVILLKFTQPS